jgi:hypothetical protein
MSDRVTVTVHDDQLAEIDQLADRLRAAGMRVDQVLSNIGVITGALPQEKRSAVREMPGVAAVEEETTFRISPPDADVQ